MAKRHRDGGSVERRRERVGPLDERDGLGSGLEREAQLLVVGRVQTVRVKVRDGDAALVSLRDGERRAGDVVGHAERPGGAPHERGLARAEVAAQGHDVAGLYERCDRRADCFGLVGAGGLELDQNSPSCSGSATGSRAGMTVTRGGGVAVGSADGSVTTASAGDGAPINPGIRAKSASSVASMDGM